MTKRLLELVRAAVVAILLVMLVFLPLGVVFRFLSPREAVAGMFCCFGTILLMSIVMRIRTAKGRPASEADPQVTMDESTRRLVLFYIVSMKVWIGILVVGLPCTVIYGIAHRASLLTLGAAVIDVSLIVVARSSIKGVRRRVNLSRG